MQLIWIHCLLTAFLVCAVTIKCCGASMTHVHRTQLPMLRHASWGKWYTTAQKVCWSLVTTSLRALRGISFLVLSCPYFTILGWLYSSPLADMKSLMTSTYDDISSTAVLANAAQPELAPLATSSCRFNSSIITNQVSLAFIRVCHGLEIYNFKNCNVTVFYCVSTF